MASRRRAIRIAESRVAGPESPKQRTLSLFLLLLLQRRFLDGRVEHVDVLRPMPAKIVDGARVDQRLENALVAEPQIDALTQVEERRERLLRARREHRLDRRLADVPDRA